MMTNLRKLRARRLANRYRLLRTEQLEDRHLLAGELVQYQIRVVAPDAPLFNRAPDPLVPGEFIGVPTPDLTTIGVGQSFDLAVTVNDLRTSGTGVFGGYLDILHNTALVKVQANEVQRLSFSNVRNAEQNVPPTSGTFSLTFAGQTTGNILIPDANPVTGRFNFDQLRARIQIALGALSNIGVGNVQVATDTSTDNLLQYYVRFVGTFSGQNVANMTIASESLVGGIGNAADLTLTYEGDLAGGTVPPLAFREAFRSQGIQTVNGVTGGNKNYYPNVVFAGNLPDRFDDIGAVGDNVPKLPGQTTDEETAVFITKAPPRELARVRLQATAVGTLTFTPDFSQRDLPVHNTLIYGSDIPVLLSEILPGTSRTLTIVEMSAVNDSITINEDTTATAIPVLANDTPTSGLNVRGVTTTGLNGAVTFSATGVTYTPAANYFGTESFTYSMGIGPSGGATSTGTVTVTVNAVNDAPTLAVISDPPAILEDAAAQTINLSGIGTGAANETQTLTVTASSSNTALIPDPTAGYSSPAATGTLTYTPVANQSGTAVITVTVADGGGVANGGVQSTTRTFTVNVTAVNDAPTLAVIPDPTPILEDAPAQTVNLSGIGTGAANETQNLTVTVNSSNTALIPQPTVGYTSPAATGTLTYTPVANQSGTAVITVTVSDGGGVANGGVESTTRSFTVNVTAVNDAPTLDAIADPLAILEDALAQTINLSGITTGGGETQGLTVTASSSNTALIPDPTVSYNSPAATGSLTYTPVANLSGTAVITVTVADGGGVANGGVQATTRSFTVTVNPVNDAPTLNSIAPVVVNEDPVPAQQVVNLGGIGTGAANETQNLTVTASSSNTALIPDPTVGYISPAASGTLTYTPAANSSGTAVITVTVGDGGGVANGGVEVTTRTFTVTVNPVNDAPSFTKGPDQSDIPDAVPRTVANWATAISRGPADESGQILTFQVTPADPSLFAVLPAISAGGTLTYTPKANARGTTQVTVVLHDDGGGTNASAQQTFNISLSAPNPWHNYQRDPRGLVHRMDVNGDVSITPLDALIIFNRLNSLGPGPVPDDAVIGPPFYDVNDNLFIEPLDALIIFNYLNAGGVPEGEGDGEAAAAASQATADAYFTEVDSEPEDFAALIAAMAAEADDHAQRRRRMP